MALTKPPVKPAWCESGAIPADIVVPSNLEIQTGWPNTATPPSRQYFNWLLNFLANGVRYLTRRGIADWAADESYLIGDCVRAANGNTYKATADNLNESPETTPSKWMPWAPTANLTHGLNMLKTTIASAATPDIFSVLVGNVIDYTGTATCTGFVDAPQAGARRTLICASTAAFTASANMRINGILSGQTYTAAAGDCIEVVAITTTQFRLVISRADGSAVSGIATLVKSIHGFTYAVNGADPSNDIDVASGGAMDVTGAYWLAGAALTKQLDVAWAVGNAAGMLDTGVIGNNDYYLWVIGRSDTGVVDYLASLSSTAPTMPANYNFKRLIGWVKRSGGANVAWKTYETAGGGLEFLWTAPTLDINLANTLTISERLDVVKVPLNFSTIAHLNVAMRDSSSGIIPGWVYCPDHTSAAPSLADAPLGNIYDQSGSATPTNQLYIRTNAAGQIAARGLTLVDLYAVVTLGFTWARRN